MHVPSRVRVAVLGTAAVVIAATIRPQVAAAQNAAKKDSATSVAKVNRSGPRFGVLLLTQEDLDRANNLHRLTTIFGWQAETDFASQGDGSGGVSAFIVGVAGVEQRQFFPTVSWLIGYRAPGGFEFGAGPNVSASGPALAMAIGYTSHSSTGLNIPFNLAFVPQKSGVEVSLTMGFNSR